MNEFFFFYCSFTRRLVIILTQVNISWTQGTYANRTDQLGTTYFLKKNSQ